MVIVVHGMGEYGRRYERSVIPWLLDHSVAVIAYDQFGHGRSSCKRGVHPGYEHLLDSIDAMIDKASDIHPGLPVFLYGHSMGGNVVLNYTLRRTERIRAVIVTSPFIRLAFEPPAWKISLARLLQKILPSMTLANEIDPKTLSKDESEVEAYRRDPLIHDRVSPAYSVEFMEQGEYILRQAKKLRKPVLLLHGDRDRLTDPKASAEFAKNAGDPVTYKNFPEGYHELHHDQERELLLNTVVDWIERNLQDQGMS